MPVDGAMPSRPPSARTWRAPPVVWPTEPGMVAVTEEEEEMEVGEEDLTGGRILSPSRSYRRRRRPGGSGRSACLPPLPAVLSLPCPRPCPCQRQQVLVLVVILVEELRMEAPPTPRPAVVVVRLGRCMEPPPPTVVVGVMVRVVSSRAVPSGPATRRSTSTKGRGTATTALPRPMREEPTAASAVVAEVEEMEASPASSPASWTRSRAIPRTPTTLAEWVAAAMMVSTWKRTTTTTTTTMTSTTMLAKIPRSGCTS
mmetsp:Transcript_27641/g.79786  ORF Transcript_27641/g.79786 Transcript_27641/m.79786 type:complete len:257 (+) Transcript_27641:396-1166(+)